MRSGRKNAETARDTLGFMWGYRVEIALVATFFSLFWLITELPWFISAPLWTISVGTLIYPWRGEWFYGRRALFSRLDLKLRAARTRRQLRRAARDSGFGDLRVERISPTLPGDLISVRVPRGQTVARLEQCSQAMAGCMRVSDVRVIHDRKDRSHAEISVIRRDPFETMNDMRWPLLEAEEASIREALPIGLDEYGRVVDSRLLSRNLLVGGAPDSGKSSFLRMPAAYAALDPNARLWMMDGKRVEFEAWRPCTAGFVSGRDLAGAVEMLTKLYEDVDRRYQRICAAGEVFVLDDMTLDVLMIDELPVYTRPAVGADKTSTGHVKTIQGLLYAIIAQGRAAGVMTIISAQKPDANTIPTEVRDLIDNKLALHCNTRAMSDTILGSGSGEEGPANAAEIPAGQPGVCFYVGDEGVRKTKLFYMTHKQALEIASRATSRQIDAELGAMS